MNNLLVLKLISHSSFLDLFKTLEILIPSKGWDNAIVYMDVWFVNQFDNLVLASDLTFVI